MFPMTSASSVLEALGDVQDRGGMYAESRAAYAATRKLLAGDATATGRVLLKEAFVAERRGRYAEAVRAIHRAERTLEGEVSPAADRLRAQLLVWLAAIRANQGLLARAIVAARDGVARAEIAGDDEARARGLLVLDFAEEAAGRAHDWQRTADALEIYTRLGDLAGEATASNLLGAAAYYDGRWAEALDWYARARVARAKHGDPVNVALVDSNITEILADQGRLAEADELIAGATATWAAADDPWGVGVAQRAQGIIAARSGRFADAATLLEASRATLDRIGAKLDVASTELAFAELNLHRGDGHAALADVARAETMGAADNLGPALLRLRGVALLQVGAFADAREQLETALADARAHGNDFEIALVLGILDAAAPALGLPPSSDRRAEAAEILRRLDIISVPGYPISSGAAEASTDQINGT